MIRMVKTTQIERESMRQTYSITSIHIALVANQHPVDVLGSILINLSHPVADVGKTVSLCDIIDQQNSHGTTIVGGGDRTETFLTSCVPDLKLNLSVTAHDRLDLEVNANGCNER